MTVLTLLVGFNVGSFLPKRAGSVKIGSSLLEFSGHRMKQLLIVTALALAPLSPVFAWSECGHHIIAAIAFDLLTESEQSELLRILEAHPRYAEDFTSQRHARNLV